MKHPLRPALGLATLLLAAPSPARAQEPVRVSPWTIVGEQKISSTQGGLGVLLASNAYFGLSMAGDLDLNGDGRSELVVGSPGSNLGGSGRGEIVVLFLNADGTVQAKQRIGQGAGGFTGSLDNDDYFGRGLWSLGDLDDDGVDDLIVGAYRDDDGAIDAGAAYVLFLNPGGTVKASTKISNGNGGFPSVLATSDLFGVRTCGIGDLDGDGVEDAVVAASFTNDGGPDRGAIYVLFLNTNGTVKAFQKISQLAGNLGVVLDDTDFFGTSVAPLGDLDGDGHVDLAVGARGDDDGGSASGAVYVLFLNPNGTVKARRKISATQGGFRGDLDALDQLGISAVAFTPDGPATSGRVTLAVGAFEDDDGGLNRGAVWLLDLDTDGSVLSHRKVSSTACNLQGPLDDEDGFGTSVAVLSDLEHDGRPNVVMGAWNDTDGGTNGGAVYVLDLAHTPARGHAGPPVAALGASEASGLALAGPSAVLPGEPLSLCVVSAASEPFEGALVLLGQGGLAPRPLALPGVDGALAVLPPFASALGSRVAFELPPGLRATSSVAAQALAWRGGRLVLSPPIAVQLASR